MKFLLRFAPFAVLLAVLVSGVSITQAHAELESSDPVANASLDAAPAQIRLWFTEPLEPNYSRFTLIDQSGTTVQTPRSEVAPDNTRELRMSVDHLDKGVYTVSWRTLSAGDGHASAGSFSFGIGVAVDTSNRPPVIDEHVAPESVAIRWADLIALSLLIGSLGFSLLVAAGDVAPAGQARALVVLAWVGWVATGVASVLMLLLEASAAGGTSLLGSLPILGDVIGGTAYGSLWLIRIALWLAAGAVLLLVGHSRRGQWLAFAVSFFILLTQSLFSHGAASQDAAAAIIGDWLHFGAATLWIGGLVAFMTVLVVRRGTWTISAESCGHLVAAFSNYARVAVLALVVSGLYAAWIDVGSLDALVGTLYGQALLMKLILFVPLLALAAVNLLVTARRLKSGDRLWVGRLRVLVTLEMGLTVAILFFAAIMTSGSPARYVKAVNAAAAQATAAQPKPLTASKMVDDLHVNLSIAPGVVGENTFSLALMDMNGKPVTDASLIRMRFDNQDQPLGESELRPTLQPDGSYAIRGANLSVPGNWRIRLTVQRPKQFDSVVDFTPQIVVAPMVMMSAPNDSLPDSERMWAALLTGVVLVAGGGVTALRRAQTAGGGRVLGSAMLAAGLVFAATGVWLAKGGGTISVVDAWARPARQSETVSVYFKVVNSTSRPVQVTSAKSAIAASTTLHQTMIMDDIAHMSDMSTFDVPANSIFELKPGSNHVMLDGLTQPLLENQTFPMMVMLSTGEEVPISVHVQDGPPEDSMSGMAEDMGH